MTGTHKPTTRCSSAAYQGRPIVVQIEGQILRFRLKGTRTWHTATVMQCFIAAARNTVEAIKAERKRLRELKRKERS